VRADELLGLDFDGNPVPDPYELIDTGLTDPRHRDRVPELAELLANNAAPEQDRFLACFALTAWAEPRGYAAVIDAAAVGKRTPWYDTLIDRMYSVDNTFAHLAVAISDGEDLATSKGTEPQRTEAVRALVGIADKEYFDGKLEYLLDDNTIAAVIDDIASVVRKGVRSLIKGETRGFDLATQLIDLAAAVASVDGSAAIALGTDVVSAESHHRPLNHAIAIVYRAKGAEGRVFGEYLKTIGDEKIREQVDEVLASR
jgi:hypothetical protein